MIPYGRNHTNPTIRKEPPWNTAETRALGRHPCFDCHSNETHYPRYANFAPISWLTERDTLEGRGKRSFSDWDRAQKGAKDAGEEVRKGEMPLWSYVPLHPDAKLTFAEQAALVRLLETTIAEQGAKALSEIGERETTLPGAPPA